MDDETDGLSPQELDDLYLIQLSMHVDDELQKPHMDLLRVATELDWSRTKLWRRLREAENRGLRRT